MKIHTFIRHDLDIELADMLEAVPTENTTEVCGELTVITVSDPDELPADIRRIAREVERIKAVRDQVYSPWAARDILHRKAVMVDGRLVYQQPKSDFRVRLELKTGMLSDEEFKTVMYMATDDIRANNVVYGKKTTLKEVIKIAAQCAKALTRCGK